jgi:cell division protein FtsN
MAKIEPGVYEPRDDIRVFDGSEDDMDEEGSRLPLLIVIALLVLAAFAGVVYLAYTEGVQKGRSDAPRVITAQSGPAKVAPTDAGGTATPYKGLKIYEQPAPTDEEAGNEDAAPPPPTEVSPSRPAAVAPAAPPATTASMTAKTSGVSTTHPPLASTPQTKLALNTPAVSTKSPPPAVKPAAKSAVTATQQVATAPPKSLASLTTAAKPAAAGTKGPPAVASVEPKPILPAVPVPAAAAPAMVSGAYVLQIGSYKSDAEAHAAFASLKARNTTLLSGYSANIKQVDLGPKGTWYRLRVGSFADKDGASTLCQRLGGSCFPARP